MDDCTVLASGILTSILVGQSIQYTYVTKVCTYIKFYISLQIFNRELVSAVLQVCFSGRLWVDNKFSNVSNGFKPFQMVSNGFKK